MGIILIIILVLLLIGALPTWGHSKSWGPYPSGGIGLILLILIILLLLGRIWGGFEVPELVLSTNDIEKSRDFQPTWFTWKGYKQGLVKGIGPFIVAHELGNSRLIQSLERRPDNMQISISPQPVIALIAGILILLVPRLLSYIVAIYLIIFGILGLVRWSARESSIAGKS